MYSYFGFLLSTLSFKLHSSSTSKKTVSNMKRVGLRFKISDTDSENKFISLSYTLNKTELTVSNTLVILIGKIKT